MINTATRPQSSMSNSQMQTRGLSSSDWTRLKRLNGAKNYVAVNLVTNKDINTSAFPQATYGLPIHVYRTTGTSKVRRTASDWIAYKASQTADFPKPEKSYMGFDAGTVQVMSRLCNCQDTLLNTRIAGCTKCQTNQSATLP